MNYKMDNPRQSAIDFMKASVPEKIWSENVAFIKQLRAKIGNHPVVKHPILELMHSGGINKAGMIDVHLEYRHAIVQIFTDALLMAQHLSKQLEPRLVSGNKMHARFLITLNILDEFGYRPGFDKYRYYQGNSMFSHYLLYESMLNDYGVTQQMRTEYRPSKIASDVKNCLESCYDDFAAVCALLAVAEEEVIIYSPALRDNTDALGIDVSSGYYFVHGVSDGNETDAYDDVHQNDLWTILYQALTPSMYSSIETACVHYCDLWDDFWSYQFDHTKEHRLAS